MFSRIIITPCILHIDDISELKFVLFSKSYWKVDIVVVSTACDSEKETESITQNSNCLIKKTLIWRIISTPYVMSKN